MEEEFENSEKIIGSIIFLILLCIAGYFLFTKSSNKKDSNKNENNVYTPMALSDKVVLKKYPKPQDNRVVKLSNCNGEVFSLSIENGRVVLTDNKGNKKYDTFIKEEVVSIVQAKTGCSCDDSYKTAVLTKGGTAYLFVGNINGIRFQKVESSQKIIGLAALREKIEDNCSDENLYAYVDTTSAHVILSNSGTATLGKLYEEIYPYDDWLILDDLYEKSPRNAISIMVTTLNGEVRLASYEEEEYKEQKVMYNGETLKIKLAYLEQLEPNNQQTIYLIGEDDSYYTLKLLLVDGEVKYTIVKEEKKVTNTSVERVDKSKYDVSIRLTDYTEERLLSIADNYFISDQIVLESWRGINE